MPQQRATATDEERARLDALRRYEILDTEPEPGYDDVTRLAAQICDTPISLITFVDSDRQWFKSRRGTNLRQTRREVAFCAHAIRGLDVMQVTDAARDERFRDNPLVTGPPHIGFYAGVPLITPDGYRIGTVCVIDDHPRTLSDEQVNALQALANQVMANLELRRTLKLVEQTRASLETEVEGRSVAEAARELSDSFMRATIDAMTDNIAIIDRGGHIVHVNRAWQTFAAANCPPELIANTGPGVNYLEICDRAAADGIHDAADVARALRRMLEHDESNGYNVEYPCHSPDEQRWFVVYLSAFGTGAERHAVVNHRNVTERHLAAEEVSRLNRDLERRVAERTAALQRAEQLAELGSWHYEFGADEVYCSQGLWNIAGRCAVAGGTGLEPLLGMIADGDRERLCETIEAVRRGGRAERLRCSVERPDGSLRAVQAAIDVMRNGDGQAYGVIGAFLDVTETDATLERLRVSQEQLRALTEKLERIREEERLAISREVHDELGQMLTALKIDMTLLARDIEGIGGAALTTDDVRQSLQSMQRLVDATIDSVRSIATQLRPELLDAFGLVPALEWHAGEFQSRTKIRCIVEASASNPQLDMNVRTAVFRIVQEAMTNAARHAGADLVRVSIHDRGDHIEVTIADNGRGISAAELAGGKSLGLVGMRERAAMIGASLDIHGEPGRGTVVALRLPVDAEAGGRGDAAARRAPA